MRFLEEMEGRLNQKIKKLEEENDDLKRKHKGEIEKIQRESEELLMQVKSAYEQEKHSLETRLKDFKQKEEQKMHEIDEEHENEIKEIRIEYEDKVFDLSEALGSMETQLNNQINNLNHEISLLKQKNESLEHMLGDKTEQISKEKLNYKKDMEDLNERHSSERRNMTDRIDNLTSELNIKEREYVQLKDRFTRFENEMKKNNEEIEEERLLLQKQRGEVEEQSKSYVYKIMDLENQSVNIKQKNDTEIALLNQKIEFLELTMKDNKLKAEKDINEYERRIKNLQEEYSGELDEKTESAVKAKEQAERKYETVRNDLNKNQMESRQRISDLEMQTAIQAEKIKNHESKIEELSRAHEEEIEKLKSKTGNQSGDYFKEKEKLTKENEDLKNKYNQLDNDYSDLKNEMDKDTTLLGEKVKFLEDQLKGTKQDLKEQARKFEMTLEQINKKSSLERNKFDNNQQALMDAIEQKYKSQIKEESDKYKKETRDLTQKNKDLEKELRQIKEKLLAEQRDRKNISSNTEKKLVEYQELEIKLKGENSQLKSDYENKVRQYANAFDQEKDTLKVKYEELEKKFAESESYKTKAMFIYEAEKSNLQRELDGKSGKIDELQTKIAFLTKENEKLKSNQRQSRKAPYGAERSSSNFGKNLSKGGAAIVNKFIKGQGSASSSISGSQKENTDIHRPTNSKFISDNFGKTTHFDQLSTSKSNFALQKADNPMNTSTYMPFDSREDEIDE